MLATLVLLTVGFARPAATTRTPQKSATVMLALDTSASMAADDVTPSRLTAAKAEASAFVRGLPAGLKVGLVSFDSAARMLVPATADRPTVLAAIAGLQTGAGTATADAIDVALAAIRALPKGANGKPQPAAIVLMSDGSPTIGRSGQSPAAAVDDEASTAKQTGVPIDTIAFGTAEGTVVIRGQAVPVPSDPLAMQRIAHESGGEAFTSKRGEQRHAGSAPLGRAAGDVVPTHQRAPRFSGIGLAL